MLSASAPTTPGSVSSVMSGFETSVENRNISTKDKYPHVAWWFSGPKIAIITKVAFTIFTCGIFLLIAFGYDWLFPPTVNLGSPNSSPTLSSLQIGGPIKGDDSPVHLAPPPLTSVNSGSPKPLSTAAVSGDRATPPPIKLPERTIDSPDTGSTTTPVSNQQTPTGV